ncbi:MAG: outer membrane protein assembly factor BamB [Betaproteobacteria bacterium]|nr:outer membrane protein assembly factor BamB [Betaproteobacteria bacterium]
MRFAWVLATALVGGCSNVPLNPVEWFRPAAKGKMAELGELKNTLAVRTLWQANVGAAGTATFTPAVVARNVYAAAADGTVIRIDSDSGKVLWRTNVGAPLTGGVGADSALVAVGTGEGEVIVLDVDSGSLRWRARVSSEVLSAPAITGDLVLVRSVDSRIFAFDSRDGKRRWVYQRAGTPLVIRSPVGVAIGRGLAIAGFPGGKLVALSLANGGARWEATVALPRGANELERVTDVVGQAALGEREVCAAAYQGRVACFDISNGNPLWARDMSTTSGLSVDVRYVFVSDDAGAVHALDRAGGSSVWKQDRLFRRNLTTPLSLGQVIAVADVQGYVHFLSRDNGQIVARVATDGSPVAAFLTPMESAFLVQTRNGGLYAFSTN